MDYLISVIGIILAVWAIFLAICIGILFAFLKRVFDEALDPTGTDDD